MSKAKGRPGGRTARTKAQAFEAAAALLAEKRPMAITMADIAARAGVAATSLYRRWGNVETLLREVAVERLLRESPLADTGSLRGDLQAWGKSIARMLRSSDASSFFRVYLATALPPSVAGPVREAPIWRRVEQLETMLKRPGTRGVGAVTPRRD
jgi:AcrR family transcriptional regulator